MFRLSRALVALVALALLALAPSVASAASPAARSADAFRAVSGTPAPTHAGRPREVDPERFHAFTVDHAALGAVLRDAPAERATAGRGADALTVTLPGPDGEDHRFAVRATAVLDAELQAAHPEIATYAGVGVDDRGATVRLDLTPLGLHASVVGPDGAWYVDPYYRGDRSLYVAYDRDALGENVHGPLVEPENPFEAKDLEPFASSLPRAGGTVTRRTYRLALVSDPSYAAYFGPENVMAAKAVLMDRVNQIYNDDVAIELQIANRPLTEGMGGFAAGEDRSGDALNLDTDAEMYEAGGPCGTAPCYPVADPAEVSCGDVLESNFTAVPQLMQGQPFDIGHIALGLNGGGVAALYAVGGDAKSIGCTGVPNPVGDYFAVDYVAHEMGHQFAGNHTFAGTQWNCATGNRNDDPGTEGPGAPGTSVEPGSGTSVMAYAGICRQDNLQPHSDPYFSQRSISEISTYVTTSFADLSEVQTVSLSAFGTGDQFALTYDGKVSSTITFAQYTAAAGAGATAIEARLAELGITAEVTPYGASPTLGAEGFSIEFQDTVDHPQVGVTGGTGGTTGFAGETVHGGAWTNGGATSPTTNTAPTVTVPPTTYLPKQTPFTLTGSGTDPDGDPLVYTWEQNDPNLDEGTALIDNVKTTGPLFRMFSQRAATTEPDALTSPAPGNNAASPDPSRTFPDLAQVVAGNTNAKTGACPAVELVGDDGPTPPAVPASVVECYAEFLPTEDYVGSVGAGPRLHFRLTARDTQTGGGGTGAADTEVRIDRSAGPFLVTSQGAASSAAAGGPLPVTWNRANTDDGLVNVQAVRILLSTDGGKTFDRVLAVSTPNDDSETVTLPAGTETSTARIKIEAIGGVFFDVSDADLTITAPVPGTGAGETPTTTTPTTTAPATTPTPSPAPAPTPSPAPAPGPAPATAGQLRPSLTSLASRLRVTSTGRVHVRVRCVLVPSTGSAPARCTGTVRIRARIGGRTVTIGSASFNGTRAGTKTVSVRLTTRGRRAAAARAGISAKVAVTLRSGGTSRTATKTVRVRTAG
jgi:hypothetical protein